MFTANACGPSSPENLFGSVQILQVHLALGAINMLSLANSNFSTCLNSSTWAKPHKACVCVYPHRQHGQNRCSIWSSRSHLLCGHSPDSMSKQIICQWRFPIINGNVSMVNGSILAYYLCLEILSKTSNSQVNKYSAYPRAYALLTQIFTYAWLFTAKMHNSRYNLPVKLSTLHQKQLLPFQTKQAR